MSVVRFRPKAPCCGSSSVGRAPPCQGGGRESEPRLPLHFLRRHSQVVRRRSAKPLCSGPNPDGASIHCRTRVRPFLLGVTGARFPEKCSVRAILEHFLGNIACFYLKSVLNRSIQSKNQEILWKDSRKPPKKRRFLWKNMFSFVKMLEYSAQRFCA